MHAKLNRNIEVFEWNTAMTFSHLLLPCVIAEVSSNPVKGITRLCFPFRQTRRGPDPENVIISLCGLMWLLAYILEKELVAKARLCPVSHKMRITEDDGELWFNKSCQSDRIATAIKVDRKSALYMYVGGGAVDHEQSFLLGGLVVVCKTWNWVALMYAAARVAGFASNNNFGNIAQELVISDDDDGTDTIPTELLPTFAFPKVCEEMWEKLCSSASLLKTDIVDKACIRWDLRSMHPEAIGRQLGEWKTRYAAEVEEFCISTM